MLLYGKGNTVIMLSARLLLVLVSTARVGTAILEDVDQADLEAVRIRLEDEKAKRLLLQNDVEVLMMQVEELKRKYDQKDNKGYQRNITLVTPKIAFTAALSKDTTLVAGQTVIFDDVKINEGNCYNSSTGRFRAPFRGLYLFSVTLMGSTSPVHALIMKDDIEIGRVYSGGTGYQSGSAVLVTVMENSQNVHVKEYSGKAETLHGKLFSTFIGLLHVTYD